VRTGQVELAFRNRAIWQKLRQAFDDWAGALSRIVKGIDSLEPVFSEVQVIRLGDLVIVALSGEPFFSTGDRISRLSSAKNTWVLGYTNAYTGYLPTTRAFREGGYEVSDSFRYLGIWQLDPNSANRVVRAARRILRKQI
jgi:hypothetical protein